MVIFLDFLQWPSSKEPPLKMILLNEEYSSSTMKSIPSSKEPPLKMILLNEEYSSSTMKSIQSVSI